MNDARTHANAESLARLYGYHGRRITGWTLMKQSTRARDSNKEKVKVKNEDGH